MRKIIEAVKRLASVQIQKSVLRQKNEWPATSFPVFFQPERPKTDKITNENQCAKNRDIMQSCDAKQYV